MNEHNNINEGAILPNNSTTVAKSQCFRKARSPHEVVFSPDPEDNFFVTVEIKKRATGQVKGQHYILKSDMPTWISYYEGEGFHEITEGAK